MSENKSGPSVVLKAPRLRDKFGEWFDVFYKRQRLDHDANRFFWVLFVVSHILVAVTLYEAFQGLIDDWFKWKLSQGWKEARDIMIEGYRYALMSYVGVNETARVRYRENDIGTPGFYMVGGWVVTFFIIGMCTIMFDYVAMPEKILIILRDVVGIYFGGKVIETTFTRKLSSPSS